MKFIRIGFIKGTHGLSGEFKVAMSTENIKLLETLEYFMLGKDRKVIFSSKIEYVEPMNDLFLVKLENINDVDTAKKYKGYEILIPMTLLPEEDDDEVYWFKIEGADVFDQDDVKVGILVDYIESGAADIFRIKGLDDKYYLISNNKDHVLSIDVRNKRVVVNTQGLVDEDL